MLVCWLSFVLLCLSGGIELLVSFVLVCGCDRVVQILSLRYCWVAAVSDLVDFGVWWFITMWLWHSVLLFGYYGLSLVVCVF